MSTATNVRDALSAFTRQHTRRTVEWKDGGVEWTNGWIFVTFQCLVLNVNLAFWFVNGILDFGVSFLTGGLSFGEPLYVRLFAYALIPIAYLVTKFLVMATLYPDAVLGEGRCPLIDQKILGLDWFAGAILMTTLPQSMQYAGAITSALLVGALVVFVAPEITDDEAVKDAIQTTGVILMTLTNFALVYLNVPPILEPLTFQLPQPTIEILVNLFNSVVIGALFLIPMTSMVFNAVMDLEKIQDIYLVQLSNPDSEPFTVVYLSSALGALYFFGARWFAASYIIPAASAIV